MRTESQKNEIEYLKEINAGMELLRRREEELQHYQRVQSIGQMSSHIAHEFNNYLTPVFVYGELLVALEADPALPSGPEALPEMPEKGWVLLSVADTGCGISKDVLDKIFEPFYTTKRSGKGTGLGLSVVQNVMTAVGGQIRIHSVPGEGTTFFLYFPRTEEKQGNASAQKPVRRIVVVDDDTDILKSLKIFLESRGYHCTCYDHPAAVLSRLQQQKDFCDAILTDYAMPSMNGLEFAQVVRKLDPGIRLVLMSGAEDVRFEWYLKNKFVDAFVLKEDLSRKLPEALQ